MVKINGLCPEPNARAGQAQHRAMSGASRQLGVCYYPEHWPETQWADDAHRMATLGITWVRIGEFAWSRLEPSRGDYQFDWLRRSLDVLLAHGLKVVLGTPTATPPRWLVDELPDMLPMDQEGKIRKFGSRRHYSFAHAGYREECRRIVSELSRNFGNHPAVAAWQIDNEYDCHDTARSYSPVDLRSFRNWLAQKYQSPYVLNRAWGNVFWSMEINSFEQVDLPNQTVTDANPAHWMDFFRFTSDMVVEFNKLQVDVIRKYSPGRAIIHNFMGRTLTFDHYQVGSDIDISSWDSYPLGFLEQHLNPPDEHKRQFLRAGDPDFQAFHHDLYRSTSGGRWWVMEQQPGPVNWAPYNPVPRDGMVYLWTMEALAHGAEVVSYFRWRQAPFAQEQLHSGLLRPDGVEAEGFFEAARAMKDINSIVWPLETKSKAAIVFDYTSAWAWNIQPQGLGFDYFQLVFDFYRGLRRLGISVDFINAAAPDIADYNLLIIPGLFSWNEVLISALHEFNGEVLIGPRSGSKTLDFQIPSQLPPDLPSDLLDLKIPRVETLRPGCEVPVRGGGSFSHWRDFAEFTNASSAEMHCEDGHSAFIRQRKLSYICGWPDDTLMHRILAAACEAANLKTIDLPAGIRLRHSGNLLFAFNYGNDDFDLKELQPNTKPLLGETILQPSGVTVFHCENE